jgi:adenosylcobinamide kinase / adenosylcobinamide-phosphate guanylyltransferase
MSENPARPTPDSGADRGQTFTRSPLPAHRDVGEADICAAQRRGLGGEGLSLVLVTGGARSGKSRFAENLAAQGRQPVVYLATAEAGDDEMRHRIREHQRRRPSTWQTVEAQRDVSLALEAVGNQIGTVLLDDVGLLVTNHLLALCGDAEPTRNTGSALDTALASEVEHLLAAQAASGWDLIVVTNEVGLGIVPATPLGRVFRDALGRANQTLAAAADAVYLLVAGLPLRIKPPQSS